MRTCPIDELQEGMVLGEPALGSNGAVLVGAGIELSSGVIASLRSRGVTSVLIESDEPEQPPIEIPDEILARVAEELAPRFRYSNLDHPVMKFLFDRVTRDKALILLNGSAGNQ